MGTKLNLVGQKFGRLTVIRENGKTKQGDYKWHCKCDCGNEKTYVGMRLRLGKTKSCGCWRIELAATRNSIHKLSKHPLHTTWRNILKRCYYEKFKYYKDYGGRGVKVCDEWRYNFKSFYDWCIANGWRKGLEVDKDIKGNGLLYGPHNCLIVTPKKNKQNRRNTLYVIYNNQKVSLSELVEQTGTSYRNVYNRIIKLKWSIEKALTTS